MCTVSFGTLGSETMELQKNPNKSESYNWTTPDTLLHTSCFATYTAEAL